MVGDQVTCRIFRGVGPHKGKKKTHTCFSFTFGERAINNHAEIKLENHVQEEKKMNLHVLITQKKILFSCVHTRCQIYVHVGTFFTP